jgi:hypothetical protein
MKKLRQNRYKVAVAFGLAILAAAGTLSATAFTSSSSPHASPGATLDTTAPPVDDRPAYDWNASPMPSGIAVDSMASARASLPFVPTLPANAATPTSMYVTDPSKGDTSEQGFAAVVHDSKYGLFQVFEQQTPMSEAQLEAWAQECNTCTLQKVAVVGTQHFLILSSPGHGLAISWLNGSLLHTIMGPEQTFSEADAVDLATNTPASGG